MADKEEINPSRVARIAGVLYLIMVPLGFFGMYSHSNLVIPGDSVTTIMNIKTAGLLFPLSIMSALLVQIVNILLVLVLYKLLKPVNKNLAILMVIFFIVSVPITMLNELNQYAVLLLLNGKEYLLTFNSEQLHAQIMFFFELHEHGIHISGLFWGLWLLPMGLLVYKSSFIPKIIGGMLIIGCFGYLLDSLRFYFFPTIEPIVLYTFWGELLLPIWLLFKGVNVEQWNKLACKTD
ncbi:MAG: DUF4386 domain-containing protein [Thiomicrorhabdus chilensis]|uniref:DUF4386 domain-containing protein n=1 Tax=Thiomicrorhabdus chilensis TaxID=63656 RepID=UPI00299D97EE|nr:DUF4386 domain-containing protein [Thiomicrorhabdus chilensis]MDX1347496.1 DUF4386 domain-containing protein [Thiomicrorhabdus chilensis]